MSTAAVYLKKLSPAEVKKLSTEPRLLITRKWDLPEYEYGRAKQVEKFLFQDWGTADGDLTGIDPKFIHPPLNEDVYDDALLVDQYFEEKADGQESDSILVLVKVYETLTATWVNEDKDTWGAERDGLKVLTRTQVAKTGTPPPYLDTDVGVAKTPSKGKYLTLAKVQDQSTERRGVFVSEWMAPGILNVRVDRLGEKQRVTVQAIGLTWGEISSQIAEVTDDHRLVEDGIGNYEGYRTHDYTFEVTGSEVISIGENGLRAVRVFEFSEEKFSKSTSGVVGTTELAHVFVPDGEDGDDAGDAPDAEVAVNLTLASVEVRNSAPLKSRVRVWSEPGILNRTEDKVGSQQAITIQAIGDVPETPGGYLLGRTRKGNYQGFQTLDYTFLRPSVLSREEDKVGSQKAIVIQAFGETPTTPSGGYVLAKTRDSDYEGIQTKSYTFLRPSVLSRTTQKRNNGKLVVQTVEAFNETPGTPSGFIFIDDSESDVEGIPTRRYRFAKGEGEVSQKTNLRNNGKLEIVSVVTLIKSDTGYAGAVAPTRGGYALADWDKREADGHYVVSATFAKGEGEISRTTRNGAAGIKYLQVTYLTGPSGSEPTLASATILTSVRSEESGYLLWRLSAVDDSAYDGQYLVDDIRAQTDGAIIVTRSGWNAEPATPVGNFYKTSQKTRKEDGGKKSVLCTWVQPPSNYTEYRTIQFKKPGWAMVQNGSLQLQPGVTKPYVSTINHTFTTSPAAAPSLYTIANWATFTLSYTDVDDKKYFRSDELPGYLGNSTWQGVNASWSGVDTIAGAASISSDPSTIPSGQQTLNFQSTPYLSSLTGVRVFRNTTTKITI